ncbi:MAG: SDR family oxidoreductase [Chloroflexi bacterium]|nr:SDR family oxidoreductase [Chloroflexota bacterium]MQC47504.1 SDR family oxidoreductase [Chloroflexota bacterium]
MDMFSLKGKHALVTGATGPLARAAAVALAEAGATVSLLTLDNTQQDEVAANSILNECWSAGSQDGQVKTVDLRNYAAVESAIDGLESAVGPIDILVNAAHGANVKPMLESTVEDWTREIDRNATAVFTPTLAVGKRMVPRGKGRVINFAANVHDRGIPNCAIYAASQGAIIGLSKNLAIEWGGGGALVEDRVTVNTIVLGFFEDVPGPQADPDVAAVLERYIPLRRLGRPNDIRGAVVYLASDRANFLNGETVTVDGAIVNHA